MVNDKTYLNNPVLDTEVEIRKLRNGGYAFSIQGILESAVAATEKPILPKELLEQILKDGKVLIHGVRLLVDGSTAWGTITTVTLETTEDTPTELATVAVATLTANKTVLESDFATIANAYNKALEAGEGIQIKANANGTGDDLLVTIWGVIK